MERLTGRWPSGLVHVRNGMMPEAIDRLAAYEDTGLNPEDFKRAFTEATLLKLTAQYLGTSPERLRELAKADQNSRLVVLPCKVGDTVYGITKLKKLDGSIVNEMKHGEVLCHKVLPSGNFCVVSAEEQFRYPVAWKFEDFGKTVFLTREEAEAALAADTNVGHIVKSSALYDEDGGEISEDKGGVGDG